MAVTERTLQRLRLLLRYDQHTGHFHWLVDRRLGRRGDGLLIAAAGDVAGGIDPSTGYVQISLSIGGKRHRLLAHRLAVMFMTGKQPGGEVDHRDGVRSANQWVNLRDVSKLTNSQNLRKARADNRLGVQGVQFHKQRGKFVARITVDRKRKCLGYFSTSEAAHACYVAAKRDLHPGSTI